jgi:hypothetical protein
VQGTFDPLEQLPDIVEREARTQPSEVARFHAKGLPRL